MEVIGLKFPWLPSLTRPSTSAVRPPSPEAWSTRVTDCSVPASNGWRRTSGFQLRMPNQSPVDVQLIKEVDRHCLPIAAAVLAPYYQGKACCNSIAVPYRAIVIATKATLPIPGAGKGKASDLHMTMRT